MVAGNGVPTNATTSFAYASGETRVTDPNGNTTTGDATDGITTYRYDDRDRVTKVIDQLGHERSKKYNSNDNIATMTDALQKQATFGWDPNDENLTSVSIPTGAKSSFDYTNTSHSHSVTKATDPQGNWLAYTYDAPGNRNTTESSAYPGVFIEDRDYNTNGTVKQIKDGNGTITAFSYDTKGNLTKVDNPAPLGDVTLTPDALSRLATMVDGKSQTTRYTYDRIDRPDVVTFHDGSTVDSDYDGDGNLTKLVDATGITSFDYDKLNRQIRKTLPDNAQLRYGYDHNGNLTSYLDAGGEVTYGYDQANRLGTLLEPGAGTPVRFDYDNDNRRTKTTYPTTPATVIDVGYDDSGRQTSVKATAGTTTLSSFTYSYTKLGADTALRQSVTDPAGTTSYTYDGLNRLTAASGALSRTYEYDIDFNRTKKTESGTATTYGYNAANQLTTVNGTATYSYDGNGNLTGGGGWTLAYNAKNQTTSITKPAGTALTPLTYAGTDQQERRQAGTTTYATSALGIASATTPDTGMLGPIGPATVGNEETKPRQGTDYYTRDNDGNLISLRADGGARYYYLFDGLGSVVGLVNTTAAKVNAYSYDPYGIQLSAVQQIPNPFRYAAGHHDGDTSLTKFGARYYNPDHARFTQRDPSGRDLPYAYAGCNPANYTDPTGLNGIDCFVAWLLLVGGFLMFAGGVLGLPPSFGSSLVIIGAGITVIGLAINTLRACYLS